MYWKAGNFKDIETNEEFIMYEYFHIGFPIPELTIKHCIAKDETEFLALYNKRLKQL